MQIFMVSELAYIRTASGGKNLNFTPGFYIFLISGRPIYGIGVQSRPKQTLASSSFEKHKN